MINITPQGQIYLCKTPLESDYKNQLTFSSRDAQLNYFNSVIQKTYADYTYIRQDNSIKVNSSIDEIIGCNYLFYRNNGFTNRYYFCFITNMQYVNEEVTLITFETDVFQTYQFDINYKPCFIEREHTNDDGYHKNLVIEDLTPKEYSCIFGTNYPYYSSHVVMATTVNPSNPNNNLYGTVYGGIYSGIHYFTFENINNLNNAITRIDEAGKKDAIESLFYLPDWLTQYNTLDFDDNGVASLDTSSSQVVSVGISIPLTPTQIGNYTPKNKKLFDYPYTYFNLSNNSGGNAIYKLEDFKNSGNNTGEFKVIGSITQGASIRIIPKNYKNISDYAPTEINDYGLNLGKYPICSWNSDSYLNWLTQNALNIPISVAKIGVGLTSSIATGNPLGAVNSAFEMANLINSNYQAELVPNQVHGNTNNGDVTFTNNLLTFSGYIMSVREQDAKIFDDYFSMFGYKTNRVKSPNITGRQNWNYVKTIDCNFDGDIPQQHLSIIRSMFNTGVTLWHSPNTMYNYNLDNNII